MTALDDCTASAIPFSLYSNEHHSSLPRRRPLQIQQHVRSQPRVLTLDIPCSSPPLPPPPLPSNLDIWTETVRLIAPSCPCPLSHSHVRAEPARVPEHTTYLDPLLRVFFRAAQASMASASISIISRAGPTCAVRPSTPAVD